MPFFEACSGMVRAQGPKIGSKEEEKSRELRIERRERGVVSGEIEQRIERVESREWGEESGERSKNKSREPVSGKGQGQPHRQWREEEEMRLKPVQPRQVVERQNEGQQSPGKLIIHSHR